jgi:TonB family protein
MTLSEARRVLDAEEDGPEVAAVAAGFETIAHFRRPPARIALIFPGKVTSRSKVGLAAVRTCVPLATYDVAAFAARMRERYGEPTTGAAELDAGLGSGEATWSDPACAIDVRAYRKGEWYDPASMAWCVDQRAAREVEAPPPPPAPTVAAPAATPAATPVVTPVAAAVAAGAEPAVERPAPIAQQPEPIPQPPPVALDPTAPPTSPVLLASVPPRYPEQLRQRRLKARVVVRATIEPDGSVGAVEVVETDRPGFGLEARVVAAVRQWRYKPATQQGAPVTAELQIPFEFE